MRPRIEFFEEHAEREGEERKEGGSIKHWYIIIIYYNKFRIFSLDTFQVITNIKVSKDVNNDEILI